MYDLGIILAILGLIIGIIFWIVPFSKIKTYIKNWFRKVNKEKILELEEKGLVIENKELLSDKKLIKKNRLIYWPVVPTMSPCFIHVAFIRYLIPLSEAGLKVNVFVFDEYYKTHNELSTNAARTHINQFKNSLLQIGLKNVKYKFLYESKTVSKNRKAVKVINKFYTYFSSLSVQHIYDISKHKDYTINNLHFLRFMKPILNMSFIAITSQKYGYTLSGIDEESLWETYNSSIKEAKNFKLTNLYIPLMSSVKGDNLHVSEKSKSKNINTSLSKADINIRVRENFNIDTQNTVTYYALNYCYFSYGYRLPITISHDEIRILDDVDNVIKFAKENPQYIDNISNKVSEILYEILRGNLSKKNYEIKEQ